MLMINETNIFMLKDMKISFHIKFLIKNLRYI